MTRNFVDHSKTTLLDLFKIQLQVLYALMLRDVKTRFFGSAWGYLIAIGWPLAHIIIILAINSLSGRLPAYGDSPALWFATGTVPFMAFSYMSRFIMFGIILNKPLLIFPHVKIMDILVARAIVEVLSATTVIVIMICLAIYFEIDFVPQRIPDAFFAIGAAFLLGLGAGVINAIIAAAWPFWATFYSLSMILLWIGSGVLFVPDALPETFKYYLAYNPVVQIIIWFRSAYYDGYCDSMIDKSYTLYYGITCLFLGLAIERLVRGRLLQG